MVFDRSLLDNIQISDDENDTHPNIDTHSLFRMRHRHRLEKQHEQRMRFQDIEYNIEKVKMKIDAGGLSEVEYDKLAKELDELNKAHAKLVEEEKKQGLDIDHFTTKEVSSKLIYHKPTEEEEQMANLMYKDKQSDVQNEYVSNLISKHNKQGEKKESDQVADDKEGDEEEEDVDENMAVELKKLEINKKYALKHKEKIYEFFKIKDYKKLREFLFANPELIHNGVLTWSLIKMVDFMAEGKDAHVNRMVYPIAHLKFIIELLGSLEGETKLVVTNYFKKYDQMEQVVIKTYNEEVQRLTENARKLADDRQKKAIQEDMEERRKYLGGAEPLDPNEVINQLPSEMVKCFVARDVEMLREVIDKMDKADAAKYMDMCIRSGLWNPGTQEETPRRENVSESSGEYDDVPDFIAQGDQKETTETKSVPPAEEAAEVDN